MNKETIKSIRRMATKHRQDVVKGIADQRSINTLILTFIIETINYEIGKEEEAKKEIYK